MKKLLLIARNEVVGLFAATNIILVNLQNLGVHWLTPTRRDAIIAIANVVLGAIVRALVTPTQVTPPPVVAADPILPVPSGVNTSAGAVVYRPGATVGHVESDG